MKHRASPDRQARSRKRRALLAGGAIMGLGATATLATWSDAVWVSASFRTDSFNVEGLSGSDEGWTDHSSEDSLAVFQPSMGTISPGATRSYSRFGLRMAPGSTVGATVTIPAGTEVAPSTHANLISMRVVRSTAETCNATSFAANSNFVVGSAAPSFGSMLTAPLTESATFTLNPGVNTALPGPAVYLCYEFSLPQNVPPAGLSNGAVTTARWAFTAVSS